MGIKMNVDFKFTVNRKEPGSADERPEAARTADDTACANPHSLKLGSVTFTKSTQIVVNGQKYASVDAMPPDVRKMYESAMAAVATGKVSATLNRETKPLPARDRLEQPIEQPKPMASELLHNVRTFILTALILGVIVGVYLLFRSLGR